MPVKILMTWDIGMEREQEYFEFVVREYLPGIQKLGFDLTDAWATVYGDSPQITIGLTLPTLDQARRLIQSQEWKTLNNELQDYIRNYSEKIVEAHGRFQF